MAKPKTAARPRSAFSFAHLLSGSKPSAEENDSNNDPDKEQRADESDEDYAKRMKRMEEREQGADESDEDYAKRMEELDDEESDDDDDPKEKAARTKERARCAAIFASPAAATRPDVAAQLAFSTDLSAAEAINVLTVTAAGSAPARSQLAERMASVKVPVIGSAAAATLPAGPQGIAQRILAAGKARRQEN